ncbi:YggU family protein [Candidatus Aerophobetes bacterium]|nr:YggU family protein [Candidatus Aerophobetes bacterium]
MLIITKTATGVTFRLRVQPGASKNEIVGVQQDAFKVRISAPPVEGKANKALIQFLAKEFRVKKSEIKIVSGHTTRIKTIHIIGEGIQKKLQNIIDSISV